MAGEPRQCRARHFYYPSLRCAETVNAHTGTDLRHHWAVDKDGQTLRWGDADAMYPVFDEMYPVFNDETANPDQVVPEARLNQVGGEHYKKFRIQPWDVIDEYGLSFYAGNALKYLLRAGHKEGALEDLRKCRHYLDKLIELESGDGSA